ncbi:MAG: hypothetical protein HOD92_22840 [Deltaproteobacteria bacterium]|nr:hypothetical protein [Deltaproteobacteria bacterium]
MRKLLILLVLIFPLFSTALCQDQKAGGGSMSITISNCIFTWGLMKYKGCYGAAENGKIVCIGQYQFQQSIDQDNTVSTAQIFIKKNGLIVPKLCDSKIITEDW